MCAIEVNIDEPKVDLRKDTLGGTKAAKKIWIDLENSPHVPFFLPIIGELEKRGHTVVLTARNCFQVCELADMVGLHYTCIGHHYGKHILAKLIGLGIRVAQLVPFALREKPDICVSHGSRSQILLASLLHIQEVTIMDYEYADHRLTGWIGSKQKKWVITPEVIPSESFETNGALHGHILHYPGIKEDVYVPSFKPDYSLREKLGLTQEDVVVTVRPPATEAHYHNPESEILLQALFKRIGEQPAVRAVLLPRTERQEMQIRAGQPELFASGKIIVPKHVVDGLDLIWCSDLVVSGGGTMNREAAALGIPVYSLFRGTLGAVDQYLAQVGKLVLLQKEQDVYEKLHLVRRDKVNFAADGQNKTLNTIVSQICWLLEQRG